MDHVTIRFPIWGFLLVLHWNQVPISKHFPDISGHDLDLLGSVTSSVTWPSDSLYPVSYSCSIVTKPLSLALFEILGSKVPDLCKSSLRIRDIMLPVPLCKIWVHIWISHPHIAYSLWHFYWAQMKGCLLVRPPMLNSKLSEFSKSRPKWGKFWQFWGSRDQGF